MFRSTYPAVAAALVASLQLLPSAAAEPLHLRTPSQVKTEGGSDLKLDPGFFMTEPEWYNLDKQVRQLQDDSTRLRAENKVLREDAGPGWVTLGIILGAFAGGVYVGAKYIN